MTPISIAIADPQHPEITQLLRQSHALMQELFASDENHFLSIEELRSPDIRFFAARQQARYIGCGALAIRPDYGEIKSMFTEPKARRAGVAKAILDRLEAQARQLKLPKLMLETGDLLSHAQRLYTQAGFTLCGPFGDYERQSSSVFMQKILP